MLLKASHLFHIAVSLTLKSHFVLFLKGKLRQPVARARGGEAYSCQLTPTGTIIAQAS